MPETRKVAVLVGSLRKGSYNRMAALALQDVAPKHLAFEHIDIGSLAFYNQDRDNNPDPSWVELKKRIRATDAVLFVTPEYNRSIPGVLKNAIDAASRPYGDSAWQGKPAAVMSVSTSALGGFGSNHHLRQCMVFLDMPCMQQPEAYIGPAAELFDEAGKLKKDDTREFFAKFMSAFADWLETNRKN
jgi:chromate reductase